MAHLFFLNGPNLNLLGHREPHIYGSQTLADIEASLRTALPPAHRLTFLQSSYEGKLIDAIHSAPLDAVDCFVINAGALTHTSIGLRDALLGVALPFIELHVSNVYHRESFRHHSYFADVAAGVIVGFGAYGYHLALDAALHLVKTNQDLANANQGTTSTLTNGT